MANHAACALIFLPFTFGLAFSQPAVAPSFEVASVKPAKELVVNGWHSIGGVPPIAPDQKSIHLASVTLMSLISRAYDVQPPDSVSGPPWLSTERYEIDAKAPEAAKQGQVPAMLQTLLVERFHLRVHRESKGVRGYALVAVKSASALSPADPNAPKGSTLSGSGHLVYSGITLAGFAAALGRLIAQPVLDATGIDGTFNITLDAAPDSLPGLNARTKAADSGYPSVFAALKQFGLALEPRNVTVNILVVDSADRVPVPN
jgi:uncharacterized protein (TIGR03435 family)